LAANIWALIKLVPTFLTIFEKIQDLYVNEQIKKIDRVNVTLNDEYHAVYKAILNAKTNEERSALSITLNRINNL
tara:strand:+ start:3829 stop:4053 length:225 start_codon:yes stop_codon:yes gene_type:complete